MSVIRRWTEFCVSCDAFVFTEHKGHGTYACTNCGAKVEPVVLVRAVDHEGAVEILRELREKLDAPPYYATELGPEDALKYVDRALGALGGQ